MVLTRAQAKTLGITPAAAQDPEALVRKVKAEAEARRVADATMSAELDALANMFSNAVSVGQTPEQALAEAMAKMGIGGRRKTRKGRGKKKSRKTRKH